jgi:hypothetical protein
VDPGVPRGYTVVRELGSGRFGRAVLCTDAAGRQIVVRISGVTGERAAALEAELRTVAAASSHPCALAVPKVWSDPELGVCFEQVYCPGVIEGPVDAETLAVGGVRLVAALAHAHRLGLLHGDLRPDDVMLDADGNWLLADAGILDAVRRARPDLAVDRDSLFSPRELRGWEAPAESADVYSLGATLRALLGDSAVGAEMDALLGRMLAPNPADRPSLVEVDEVLRAAVPSAVGAGLPARPEGPRPAPAPPRPAIRVAPVQSLAAAASNRRKTMLVAASIGAVFVVGAGAVAVANAGSDHGGATVAAASASLPAAPDAAAIRPSLLFVTPVLDGTVARLLIEFSVPSVPPSVHGYRVIGLDPAKKANLADFVPVPAGTPTGPHTWKYPMKSVVPISWCVRVDTGDSAYSSEPQCPDPKRVSAVLAQKAKADKAAAAKKAAAKKAAAKKG